MASTTARAAPAALEPPPFFGDLYRPEALQAANEHIFPSLGSLLWFARVNRRELEDAGAIVEIGGKKFLRGSVFICKALEIGSRRAAARGRGREAGAGA